MKYFRGRRSRQTDSRGRLIREKETRTPEATVVFLLCVLGACRVGVFCAAFPPFTNVDEQAHFDLVYKYAHGLIPRTELADFSGEAAEIIILNQSPEYLVAELPGGGVPPPLWSFPNARQTSLFQNLLAGFRYEKNHEAGSFPVYYLVAGAWFDIGRCLGLGQVQLVYWVRFLNPVLFLVFVYLSYKVGKLLFPQDSVALFAMVLLTAFFPQDAFYTINNDALSPALFAAAMLMLLRLYFEAKGVAYHIAAGGAVAAAFLTKVSNVAAPVLLGIIVVMKVAAALRRGGLKKEIAPLAGLLLAAGLPVCLWLLRNMIVFGDMTASAGKSAWLGWTRKPASELLNHPLFTLKGAGYFLAELTRRFWRGEFVWHWKDIASGPMDLFYVISTAVCMAGSCAALILGRKTLSRQYRLALYLSFCAIAVSVLFLAALSLLFDFGHCINPSREKPYFVSARLIVCVLMPFVLVYLHGLKWLCSTLTGNRLNVLFIVVPVVVLITCSEVLLSINVFASPYNWFHLR